MEKDQFVIAVGNLPYNTIYSKRLKAILDAKEDTLEAMANAFAYGCHIGSGKEIGDEQKDRP
ncbi:MAG: hypothetical protein Q4E29_08570 [Lachnospiraceae bacterium]|nr:hypothetical protein [Lachnospiraceae bacterium]